MTTTRLEVEPGKNLAGVVSETKSLLKNLVDELGRFVDENADRPQLLGRIERENVTYLLLRMPRARFADLRPREREVAVLASQGLSNKAIARRLRISTYTVAAHLRHVFRIVGVRTRAELAHQLWGLELLENTGCSNRDESSESHVEDVEGKAP